MKIPKIPYTILALAPLGPMGSGGHSPPIVTTHLTTLDEAMRILGPQISIAAPDDIYPGGRFTLKLKSIKAFKPDELIQTNPDLKRIWDAGQHIEKAMRSGVSASSIAQQIKNDWPDLPLDVSVQESSAKEKASSGVDDILSMVALPSDTAASGGGGPAQWKAQVDSLLANLMEFIFDDIQFKTYEAAWRGVHSLLKQGPIREGEGIQVKLTLVNAETLEMVLKRIENELAHDLPDLILIDLPFDSTQVGIDRLTKLAEFAETMLTPMIGWITPGLLHLKHWGEHRKLPLLKHHLDEFRFAKWRKFQASPACHWLGLTCNGYLGRDPYGDDNQPRRVQFREKAPLWLSPVWAFGALCAQSINRYGWPARFTQHLEMRLTDLPVGAYGGKEPISTETALDEDRVRQFVECGITPLVGQLNKDIAMMPREAAVSGISLRSQLFTARIFHFLFWLQENLEPEDAASDAASIVAQGLTLFWRQTGYEPPSDLEVRTETQGGGDDNPFLVIAMTPPSDLWPGSERLEFTFNW